MCSAGRPTQPGRAEAVAEPEVSVVIPTRDRPQLLERAVAGVLRQEGVSVEVVVVDDGSPDRKAEAPSLEDPRVRVLRNDGPPSVSTARNCGIRHANGEWVAFLDDDDLWSPRKLRLQLDAMSRAGATAAFGAAVLVDEQLRVMEVHRVAAGNALTDEILRRSTIPAGASNVVASTELVRQLGGFDEVLAASSDWDMWIRLALHGTFASVSEILVAYVHHSTNMSIGDWDDFMVEFEEVDRKYAAERARRGVELDGVGFSRWLAGEQRRGGDWRGAIRTYLGGARRHRSLGNAARAAGVPVERLLGRRGRRRSDPSERVDWLRDYV